MKNLFITTITLLALSFSNCKKDTVTPPGSEPEAPQPAVAGNLKLEFKAMVGDSALVFNTETYTNQAGNTFNVTKYKYFISNIKLTRTDNSIWTETNSYHIVDHLNLGSTLINIANVPFGDYKNIEFMVGVDSARNISGAQTGALDVNNDMYWSWNQTASGGYIMAKFEGTSPQSSALGNKLVFHIGGYAAPNNALKILSPSFNNDTAKVTSSVSPTIHMTSNLLEWFDTPTPINFSTLNAVHMAGTNAKLVAGNYADMFKVENIHNN